jgi:hypothetical protein
MPMVPLSCAKASETVKPAKSAIAAIAEVNFLIRNLPMDIIVFRFQRGTD